MRRTRGEIWRTSAFFKNAVVITGVQNLQEFFRQEAQTKRTAAFFPPHHKLLFGSDSVLIQSGPYHDFLRRILQEAISKPAVQRLTDALIVPIAKDFVESCIASPKEEDVSVSQSQSESDSAPASTKTTGPESPLSFAPALQRCFLTVMLSILLGSGYRKEVQSDSLPQSLADSNSGVETPGPSFAGLEERLRRDVRLWARGLLSAPLTFIPWSHASIALRARERLASQLGEWVDAIRNETADSGSVQSGSEGVSVTGVPRGVTPDGLLWRLATAEVEETPAAAGDPPQMSGAKGGDGGGVGKRRLSRAAVIDNALTLVFAGTDTTASAMTSALSYLSVDPDMQSRLAALCASVEETRKRAPRNAAEREAEKACDDALEEFFEEILRKFPPAPFQVRQTLKSSDSQAGALTVSGYDIPPGWLVVLGIAGTLVADEKAFPNPLSFDSSRWKAVRGGGQGGVQRLQVAFSGGKRMCPGSFLARVEAREMLRAILSPGGMAWNLKESQDLTLQYTPGLFPVDGLKLWPRRR
eukprot:Cvel_4675.t1-p1 / transcript=Cvel_4675.t1 / gene=Cvel_4675 / organism=Chromera_velia_CCMP2878 / gene_product=Putative cytochrome P450 120, putative / transcript_product=Putative cytochrome P450 120, putative / location=Cvel_scaffold207:18650-20230(-) / protein_length=527 / sequence_SO=supercontig / SO=protein_coding / is_pseudo=false